MDKDVNMKLISILLCLTLLLISGCAMKNNNLDSSSTQSGLAILNTAAASTPTLSQTISDPTGSTSTPSVSATSTFQSKPTESPILFPITTNNISELKKVVEINGTGKIEDFYWSPDDLIAVTGDTLNFFEEPLFNKAKSLEAPARERFWGQLPDNSNIFAYQAQDGGIRFWDSQNNKDVYKFEWPRVSMDTFAIQPNARLFARAGTEYYEDGGKPILEVVDIVSGNTLYRSMDHKQTICSLSFSSGGNLLASSACGRDDQDNIVFIRDTTSGNVVKKLTGPFINWVIVAFGKTSNLLAVASDNETVQFWNAETNDWQGSLEESQGINQVGFNNDDTLIEGLTRNGNLGIWEVNTGRILFEYRQPADRIVKSLFSPDGKYLATLHSDGRIVIWGISQ